MRHRAYNQAAYKRARRAVKDALAAGAPLTCSICGVAPATTVDHRTELDAGGTNMAHNLRPACAPCNYGRKGRQITRYVAKW